MGRHDGWQPSRQGSYMGIYMAIYIKIYMGTLIGAQYIGICSRIYMEMYMGTFVLFIVIQPFKKIPHTGDTESLDQCG